ncbi:hypothetical protein L484_004718 [Morus notabilis]|uniref:Uncharacterized protein n=1 Tax=Morus notabilis TaxID=981085 RepID=W9S1U7_9ROSA|nr:hypothetical protein L484_004718 [Morus notabilis]
MKEEKKSSTVAVPKKKKKMLVERIRPAITVSDAKACPRRHIRSTMTEKLNQKGDKIFTFDPAQCSRAKVIVRCSLALAKKAHAMLEDVSISFLRFKMPRNSFRHNKLGEAAYSGLPPDSDQFKPNWMSTHGCLTGAGLAMLVFMIIWGVSILGPCQ